MVYGIMKRHDGTIEVSSDSGQGTTVSLVFPVRQGALAREPRPAPSRAHQRQLRVLVVDDEELVREVIAQYLANDGHVVEIALGAVDALSKFRAGSYDLVVTDRGMPEMTGDQVAAAMKEIRPETPIILTTGFGDLMQVTGDRPPAVDEIVSKPVRMAALRDAVARLTAA
jgi:CheY-like chemotaxis protein